MIGIEPGPCNVLVCLSNKRDRGFIFCPIPIRLPAQLYLGIDVIISLLIYIDDFPDCHFAGGLILRSWLLLRLQPIQTAENQSLDTHLPVYA